MPQITVNRKPNGKADIPPGTVYTVVAATPTTLTIEVDRTPAEVANEATIEDRLRARLDANRTYLALDTPTAAQQRAQVARLTRQNTALIRHLLRDLTDTSDT